MQNLWSISGDIARIETPLLSGEIEPRYPWRGFSPSLSKQLGVAILKADLGLVAGEQPETLVDLYQRGVDLVATYAQSPERNFRPQIYWRYVAETVLGHEVAGLELIVSAQTSLLDSQPQTIVESSLPVGEWQILSTTPAMLVLWRPRAWSVSYCQMISAEDLAESTEVAAALLPTLRWQLFHERLEKGVIRRGRVRGLIVPRERDAEVATACCAAFLHSPLVLST